MDKCKQYGDVLENKKPVSIGYIGDIPLAIYWLDNIDRIELSNGILKCDYYFFNAFNYHLRTTNEKLHSKTFKFEVKSISLEEIKKITSERQFDLNHSVYYWLAKEARKVKDESDNKKEPICDIQSFGIECMQITDKKIMDEDQLIEYLKLVKELDVSYLRDKNLCFVTPYENDREFGRNFGKDFNYFHTEQEVLIEKTLASYKYIYGK